MKMFLKGGSCIEVSDDDYICTINKEKIGFFKRDELKKWSNGFDDFIIPREFVERIEI